VDSDVAPTCRTSPPLFCRTLTGAASRHGSTDGEGWAGCSRLPAARRMNASHAGCESSPSAVACHAPATGKGPACGCTVASRSSSRAAATTAALATATAQAIAALLQHLPPPFVP
jgi:hypothetical protein